MCIPLDLQITYDENLSVCDEEELYINKNLPFAASKLFFTTISKHENLVCANSIGPVYKFSFDTQNIEFEFKPGDTIGIIPQNDIDTINKIIVRLNIEAEIDIPCKVQILDNNICEIKKLAAYVHYTNRVSTLKHILTHQVDLQSPPRKVFLKSLIPYTSDEEDLKILHFITNSKTSNAYIKLINSTCRNILDCFNFFSSSYPPIEILFQHLPLIKPRIYSISSSPSQQNQVDITFSVLTIDSNTKGLCTGWLENCKDNPNSKIPFYFRQSNNFQLPNDLSIPIIMIATGTGIAPFRSFYQHRSCQIQNGTTLGKAWLIYGCRTETTCLYKNDINKCLKIGALTKANFCYSREGKKCYVQDCIESNSEEIMDLILLENCIVYVCGRLKTTVKDVKNTFVNIFVKNQNLTNDEAVELLKTLEQQNKFLVDTWI